MALKIITFILLMLMSIFSVSASELVYQPVNPSFGGNPYNASWLMQQAEAQNTFKAPQEDYSSRYSQDALENFKESLNRQILSRFASQLTRDTFGEDMMKPGHYEIGDYVIDVINGDQGIQVNIYDNATGNETNIVVPYY